MKYVTTILVLVALTTEIDAFSLRGKKRDSTDITGESNVCHSWRRRFYKKCRDTEKFFNQHNIQYGQAYALPQPMEETVKGQQAASYIFTRNEKGLPEVYKTYKDENNVNHVTKHTHANYKGLNENHKLIGWTNQNNYVTTGNARPYYGGYENTLVTPHTSFNVKFNNPRFPDSHQKTARVIFGDAGDDIKYYKTFDDTQSVSTGLKNNRIDPVPLDGSTIYRSWQ